MRAARVLRLECRAPSSTLNDQAPVQKSCFLVSYRAVSLELCFLFFPIFLVPFQRFVGRSQSVFLFTVRVGFLDTTIYWFFNVHVSVLPNW